MGTTTQRPQLDPIVLDGIEDRDAAELVARAELHSARYEEVSLPRLDLANAHLDGIHFDGVAAERAAFTGASFTEVVFERVNIPVVDAPRLRWVDVRFGGRMGAFTAYEASLRSVHFAGCKLGFVNLRSADLLDVAFTDCAIEELDLAGATCRRVLFENSRVGSLDAQHATLAHVDLREAELATISGVAHLRGATVTPEQVLLLAPLLADHIGLITEDGSRR